MKLETRWILVLFLSVVVQFVSHSQTKCTYDSLAASDTLSWPQMQYLDSVMQHGVWSMEHGNKLKQLGVIIEVQEKVEQAPEHIQKLDSLLMKKSKLVQEKILNLSSNTQHKLDSSGQLLPLNVSQYNSKMEGIDGLIEQYSSELTNGKERSWLQGQLSQLKQMDGALNQYQGKILNVKELEKIQGYKEQLQQLTDQSQRYFQEAMGLLKGGPDKDKLLSEEGLLFQRLQSLIGNRREFQELQAQIAELEQFRAISQKYGQNYALKNRQEARQRLLDHAKKIGAKAFGQHQDKVQEVQEKFQKLKMKYSSLGDARDLSTGVKRSSLKDEPFKKRLVIGGTMQIQPSHSRQLSNQSLQEASAAIDLSPTVGYRLNKNFTLGVGATYRAQLDKDAMPWNANDNTYGGSGFLKYYPSESYFLHGEYLSMMTSIADATASGELSRRWVNSGLIGIGKEYVFFKGIKGQVMVLYNLLHEHGESPYRKPFMIRFGFTK